MVLQPLVAYFLHLTQNIYHIFYYNYMCIKTNTTETIFVFTILYREKRMKKINS